LNLVRSVALSRQEAPQFTALMEDEVVALRMLPGWVRWLYLELVAMSDFKTGLIYTSYARLASLLDCDQPTQGGKRLDVPTIKQIRTALDTLNRMNLALRDRAGNEEKRELKIFVRPRQGLGASEAKEGRGKGRPQTPQNYDKHGAERKPDTQLGQRVGQGVQDPNTLLPPPLHVDNLSTRGGRRNTSELTPKGVEQSPSGARPPGDHTRPPRGQNRPLPGHAPRALSDEERAVAAAEQAERIRVEREVWAAQRAHEPPGLRLDDPTTWATDEEGRVVLPIDHPSNQARRQGRGPQKAAWS
jgi:hypothetical protein